ncbi:recombinase family protein [Lachnospiraceae bacterium NSJ-143]|nr:recombinase family protein [Lachnospiraceae bacterium NSJ-143]
MLEDCKEGKFNMIYCLSMSRLAWRNFLSLIACFEQFNIYFYFEKEGIRASIADIKKMLS